MSSNIFHIFKNIRSICKFCFIPCSYIKMEIIYYLKWKPNELTIKWQLTGVQLYRLDYELTWLISMSKWLALMDKLPLYIRGSYVFTHVLMLYFTCMKLEFHFDYAHCAILIIRPCIKHHHHLRQSTPTLGTVIIISCSCIFHDIFASVLATTAGVVVRLRCGCVF